MSNLSDKIFEKTENVLALDKKNKHGGFLFVFKRDLENLLNNYFTMDTNSVNIDLFKSNNGNIGVKITAVNVKPKKVGINA